MPQYTMHVCRFCGKRKRKKCFNGYLEIPVGWAITDPCGTLCPACYKLLQQHRKRVEEYRRQDFSKMIYRIKAAKGCIEEQNRRRAQAIRDDNTKFVAAMEQAAKDAANPEAPNAELENDDG